MNDIARSTLSELDTIGFTCLRDMVSSSLMSELRLEAIRNKKGAKAVSSTAGSGYQAHLSGLGEAGLAFLSSSTMMELLRAMFDIPLVPSTDASCYTYYQPGDFLGAHTDHAEQCLVTAILYLDVVRPDQEQDITGLELHILEYATPGGGRTLRAVMPTKAGVLVLGLGSANWHERPMLQEGEHLIAMTACYSRPAAALPLEDAPKLCP
jgi:hypothetical protein